MRYRRCRIEMAGAVFCALLALGPALTVAEESTALSDAAFARHVRAVRERLGNEQFTIVVTRPFVVIGDEAPDVVRRRARDTVQWAVRKLKQAYFRKDPDEILDIWLFKDQESYETHGRKLFKTQSDSPYGYFSQADGALVMNIATGGGTLVHEIVHPYVAANFPECPTWFNEGLASLYEQCGEEDGKIHGYTNWRLPGLQRTIRAGALPSFKKLCATTTTEFYDKDPGSNYAQARYLCYYLQQKGLLQKFYQRFAAAHEHDPSGYRTLQEVLGEDDMPAFQRRWEAYVLTLEFR